MTQSPTALSAVQTPPDQPERTFAFLVHPRADVGPDLARVWSPLGRLPESALQWGMRRLPVPPLPLATVRRGDRAPDAVAGWIIVVPVGARQMLREDRRWVVGKIEAAIDHAEGLGASVVGLGALTAPATGAGRLLRERPGLALTTGNAFTAHLTVEGLRRLLPAAPGRHLAIVGATGSVGSCVVRLLARDPLGASSLTLVARRRGPLEELAASFAAEGSGVAVRTATSLDAVRDADLVLVLTSASDTLIGSEHLKPGAIVLDDTQPRNTDPALVRERPDVRVIDGGIASIPGLEVRGDIGLPRGLAYACLCETMLMAFSGQAGAAHNALGEASVEQALRMRQAAHRFSHLGFSLARPLSFGRPAEWPQPTAPSLVPELAS